MRVRKDSPLLPSERPNVLRAIYLIGLLYRHFEFDAHMPPPNFGSTSPEKVGMAGESEEEGAGTWRKLIFRILIEMCRFVKDDQIATKAFMALGNFCATHGESLQDVELQSIYHKLMLDQRPLLAPHILMLKQQALANIETFLLADEHMMAQSYEEWQQKKDQEDIKEMNDVSSGMGSAVIQLYWNPVMQCYFSADAAVRIAAHRVIALTLQQGLVTPGMLPVNGAGAHRTWAQLQAAAFPHWLP
jgi:cohesin loading factor subunit SCC2